MELAVAFFWLVSSLHCSIISAQPHLALLNDATIAQSGDLWLTSDQSPRSTGRAMHDRAIQICNTTAGFSTSFVFSIQNSTATRGDGLAFIISGNLLPAPSGSSGSWLGLFDPAMDRERSNKLVAVEFDSVHNPELQDINDDHVGVDINQIRSQVSPTFESDAGNRVDLHDSSANVSAWIEYDAVKHSLVVFVARNSRRRPAAPLVPPQPVNLCEEAAVEGAVFVGFSAATGDLSRDVHIVHAWNFSAPDLRFSRENFTGLSGSSSPPPRGGGGESGGDHDQEKNGSRTRVVVIVSVVFSLLLLLVLGGIFLICKRMRLFSAGGDGSSDDVSLRGRNLEQNIAMPSELSYRDLKSATANFDPKNLLGSGGFGNVYAGLLPGDGSPVAVKRIGENSRQGEREFLAEVEIITKLSHRNLVHLRGWCCRSRELLLVYEFMPNGSLDKAIATNSSLDWSKRYEIICGLAAALLYLHEECEERIVHRDVKPSNVMLDAGFNARLGDFGLARLIDRKREARTTAIAGTFGYLAPELNITGQCTTASDVYSFGIVLLEVASGKKPFFDDYTVLGEWIWELYRKRSLVEAADPALGGVFDGGEMESVLTIGLACSDPSPRNRPTMRQVVNSLKGNAPALPELRRSREVLEFDRSVSMSASSGSFPFPTFTSSSNQP
ncbi:L-type lectin-domain containing receptor kinase IV.2 [Selaginella moellendorffii]|uniref:L-type lectin-domain containing receptor kinase IV.2 n=1 Tax=Selaginella moellendorffii TaxID=88036 RepID=UPI000D1CE7EF|nr:L-type lectin-domain containing receptor kinase IV.2 [Selaginella moellendorffii]|eukprot:XP_024526486.1 L-type lectin-domain containing receptor kinase IV.2 [Selaginella moellendorffii]